MSHAITSNFNSKPAQKSTWVSMWLGLASLLTPPVLGTSAAVLRPYLDSTMGSTAGSIATTTVALVCFAFVFFSLAVNINTFRKGERSWAMWLGLIPVLLVASTLFILVAAEIFEYIWYLITSQWLGY